MTQYADLLATLAQVFIALAGFAGVVAACGRFRLTPEATAYRVRLTVAVALLALLASLLPLVLGAAQLADDAVRRLSASFFASGAIAVGLWAWQRVRPLHAAELLDTQIATAIWCSVTGVLVAGLFGVGAGFLGSLAPAIYLGALFFCAVLCAFDFLMLMLAVEPGKRG